MVPEFARTLGMTRTGIGRRAVDGLKLAGYGRDRAVLGSERRNAKRSGDKVNDAGCGIGAPGGILGRPDCSDGPRGDSGIKSPMQRGS